MSFYFSRVFLFFIFFLLHHLSFAVAPQEEQKPLRILVLEGGGIHGLLSAKILQALEQQAHQPLSQLFDLMVGTSTGALQIAFLNRPIKGTHKPLYSTTDIVNSYSYLGPKALKVPFSRNLKTLWGLREPRISTTKLENFLKEKCGDYRLKESLTTMIVPVYDLNQSSLLLFKSNDPTLGDYKVFDILLSAIAIPNILQAHGLKINNEMHYLNDATLVSNNPVVLTIFQAALMYPNRPLIIVSIGTGKIPPPSNPKLVGRQGTLSMLSNWMHMIYRGHDHTTKSIMHHLANSRLINIEKYYRIDPMVSRGIGSPLDVSVKNMSMLNTDANSYIKTHHQYFEEIIATLKESH